MIEESSPYCRGVYVCPNSDGRRLWAIGLERVGGYESSLADLPTEDELERYAREREARTDAESMLARAADIPRLRGGRGE